MAVKITTFCILFSIVTLSMWGQSQQKVSAHVISQKLQKGKVIKTEADIFFKFPEGKIMMHQTYPEEFIYLSNPLGEAKMYIPEKNQVVVKANEMFTSRNQNLYYFLTNQTYDLGLENLGFKVTGNEQDDQFFITNWEAPDHSTNPVKTIQLVHENLLPIHADYKNMDGESVLKVYFESYKQVSSSQIPEMITEIVYTPGKDSLITRFKYSDFRWGSSVADSSFEFSIPENAKVIK
jgi:hypothetical protein